ncbi:hypothetical protein NXY00_00980 [Bacteroides sp. BFG-551]|nr:hypothetical protein [Bacteroides sp. BFG-551]
MKTKHLLGALLSFLCTIFLFSCGNDDEKRIYPLSFEKEYYERPLLGAANIMIRGGNRDYTVTVEKTEILSIDVDLSSSIGMGSLKIYPKKKGETKVSVKDNITNETVDLKIKITDVYRRIQ